MPDIRSIYPYSSSVSWSDKSNGVTLATDLPFLLVLTSDDDSTVVSVTLLDGTIEGVPELYLTLVIS